VAPGDALARAARVVATECHSRVSLALIKVHRLRVGKQGGNYATNGDSNAMMQIVFPVDLFLQIGELWPTLNHGFQETNFCAYDKLARRALVAHVRPNLRSQRQEWTLFALPVLVLCP